MKNLVIIGSGGHARVIADMVLSSYKNEITLLGFLDNDESKHGDEIFGKKILGNDDLLPNLVSEHGDLYFIIGLGTIKGGNVLRQNIYDTAQKHGAKPTNIIHKSAIIASDVLIGDGVAIMAGAIINTGAIIGINSIINTGAIIDHDCKIGQNVHIAPRAALSGNVKIGDNALIGIGAIAIQGINIGDNATIGAGATIHKNVEQGATIIGASQRNLGA